MEYPQFRLQVEHLIKDDGPVSSGNAQEEYLEGMAWNILPGSIQSGTSGETTWGILTAYLYFILARVNGQRQDLARFSHIPEAFWGRKASLNLLAEWLEDCINNSHSVPWTFLERHVREAQDWNYPKYCFQQLQYFHSLDHSRRVEVLQNLRETLQPYLWSPPGPSGPPSPPRRIPKIHFDPDGLRKKK